jgi:drug/metabolite transporter (DMT)-like permease
LGPDHDHVRHGDLGTKKPGARPGRGISLRGLFDDPADKVKLSMPVRGGMPPGILIAARGAAYEALGCGPPQCRRAVAEGGDVTPSLSAAASRLYGQAYVLLALTALTWGSNTIAARLAIGHVSPMVVVSLRWLVVVVLLGLFARRAILAELPQLIARWRWLFLMGGLGYTGFNAFFYLAAHHTTAINLGIIQSTMPAFVLLGSLLVYRTPIRLVQTLGVVITLAGVVTVAARGDLGVLATLSFNVGDVWMIIGSLLYSSYIVGLPRRPAVSGIAFFSAMALAAFLSSLPLLAIEMLIGQAQWPDPKGWLVVGYIALMPSFLSQLLFMRGVELIGPGRAGIFVNLVPIFAAILGVMILGETFAAYHAAGLALVLGGIWLAEQRRA